MLLTVTATMGQTNERPSDYSIYRPSAGRNPIIFPLDITGRYLTRSLNKENAILSLAEVDVFRSPRDLVNLARRASPLIQSSTFQGGVPSRATDGNTDGNWSNGSVTHTQEESQPFWQADLGSIKDIEEIRIYNRTDCCWERLQGFAIKVSENPIRSNGDGTLYATGGWADGNPFISVASLRARYVRIYLLETGYLSLAEVEIMGIQ